MRNRQINRKYILTIPILLSSLLLSCISYDDLIDRGKEKYDSGNFEEARANFEKALTKDSTRAEAYYGLGFILAEECRVKHRGCEYAVNYFTKVIRIDSNYRHAFYNRANCFIELGMHKQALHDLNTTQSVSKEDADYYGNRVVCYLSLEDTVNAMSSYQKAVQLDKNKRADYLDFLFREYASRRDTLR